LANYLSIRTSFEGVCLICRLWGGLSLQVREKRREMFAMGQNMFYLCIRNKDSRKDNLVCIVCFVHIAFRFVIGL
jgi:hypothetical protein